MFRLGDVSTMYAEFQGGTMTGGLVQQHAGVRCSDNDDRTHI